MKVFLVLLLVALMSCNNSGELSTELDSAKSDLDSFTNRIKTSETLDSLRSKSEKALDSVKSKGEKLIDRIEVKINDEDSTN